MDLILSRLDPSQLRNYCIDAVRQELGNARAHLRKAQASTQRLREVHAVALKHCSPTAIGEVLELLVELQGLGTINSEIATSIEAMCSGSRDARAADDEDGEDLGDEEVADAPALDTLVELLPMGGMMASPPPPIDEAQDETQEEIQAGHDLASFVANDQPSIHSTPPRNATGPFVAMSPPPGLIEDTVTITAMQVQRKSTGPKAPIVVRSDTESDTESDDDVVVVASGRKRKRSEIKSIKDDAHAEPSKGTEVSRLERLESFKKAALSIAQQLATLKKNGMIYSMQPPTWQNLSCCVIYLLALSDSVVLEDRGHSSFALLERIVHFFVKATVRSRPAVSPKEIQEVIECLEKRRQESYSFGSEVVVLHEFLERTKLEQEEERRKREARDAARSVRSWERGKFSMSDVEKHIDSIRDLIKRDKQKWLRNADVQKLIKSLLPRLAVVVPKSRRRELYTLLSSWKDSANEVIDLVSSEETGAMLPDDERTRQLVIKLQLADQEHSAFPRFPDLKVAAISVLRMVGQDGDVHEVATAVQSSIEWMKTKKRGSMMWQKLLPLSREIVDSFVTICLTDKRRLDQHQAWNLMRVLQDIDASGFER